MDKDLKWSQLVTKFLWRVASALAYVIMPSYAIAIAKNGTKKL